MELVYTSLLILITLHFTCAESKICSTIKNSADCQKKFILLFMSLLTALIAHILARICLIFLKKRPRPNLK